VTSCWWTFFSDNTYYVVIKSQVDITCPIVKWLSPVTLNHISGVRISVGQHFFIFCNLEKCSSALIQDAVSMRTIIIHAILVVQIFLAAEIWKIRCCAMACTNYMLLRKNPRSTQKLKSSFHFPWLRYRFDSPPCQYLYYHRDGISFASLSNSARCIQPLLAKNVENDVKPYKFQAYLAVGSNLGDRFQNIREAFQLLESDSNVRLTRTSFLYETKPMYISDQPAFLNGAVEIQTNLDPFTLLQKIKHVEAQLGRDFTTIRNGPRPVDLDILTYAEINNDERYATSITLNTEELTIPHARIHERDFVLIPFIDVVREDFFLPGVNMTLTEALLHLQSGRLASSGFQSSATRVLPLPRGRLLRFNETLIMGILNVTPDSFSDGGQWTASIDAAVNKALSMEREGAAIIDVGGESTRPGAAETSTSEQIRRTVTVIKAIREGMYRLHDFLFQECYHF
jgi:2-amino-4-hydroxy-6-hydroxymethyldihydropteridine diphosphokinase